MDSARIDDDQVVARYLAGQLSSEERDAFERSLCECPEICKEVERTLKFKEGLARLHERGELDALLRTPSAARWRPYAAAAVMAVLTLGALQWFYPRSSPTAVLALSSSDLGGPHGEPPAIRGIYELARTRGASPITDVKLPGKPGAIELRVVPSESSPSAQYLVRLRHLSPLASGIVTDQIDAGPAAPDGYVTIYVNTSQLSSGDYEVSLNYIVTTATATQPEPDRFVIRVR
jgi:hypothetical protein